MHSNVPSSSIISAITRAMRSGFQVNDDLDVYDNYQFALEWLYEHQPKRLPLIQGSYSIHSNSIYMDGVLPLSGHYWVQGELTFNPSRNRYEEVVQDEDGRCYLLIA